MRNENDEINKKEVVMGDWYEKITASNDLLNQTVNRLQFFFDGEDSDKIGEPPVPTSRTFDMLESAINTNKYISDKINTLTSRLIDLF